MEKLYFIFETSQSLSNTGMGTIVGDWENEFSDDEKCIFKKNLTSTFYNF